MNTQRTPKIAAVIISAFLILSASFSLLYLLFPHGGAAEGGFTAGIYQDGKLLYSIPLNHISQSRSLVIESPEGGMNEIEIRPGCIGVISADCPDRLCVRQGFISDARLPVACLPNRLVILLRPARDGAGGDSVTPDFFTY